MFAEPVIYHICADFPGEVNMGKSIMVVGTSSGVGNP